MVYTVACGGTNEIMRFTMCVGRTNFQVAFWPAHFPAFALPLPGQEGNFTLSGSDRSTPQHSERYRPWK
jgi:hypothetical protein